MNTDLRKKKKKMILKEIFLSNFERDFFFNAVFGKTMDNVRKYRDIKVVATERRKNYLKSESNYHTKSFSQDIY